MSTFNGSEHFSLKEIRCKDGTLPSDLTTLKKHLAHMETFRVWYNKPMTINSWYRSASYNKKVGGVSGSQHLTGNACDWSMPTDIRNASATRKQEWVRNVAVKWHSICGGGGAVGVYDTFIHLDSRANYVNFDYRSTTKNKYTIKWK